MPRVQILLSLTSICIVLFLTAGCSMIFSPLEKDVESLSPEQKWAHDNNVTVGQIMRMEDQYPNISENEKEILWAYLNNYNLKDLDRVKAMPLDEFTPKDVDMFARWLSVFVPDLTERVRLIAMKGIGQDYSIFLLGEAPFETWDPAPLYTFKQSDCVVFVEHVYAMALAYDWRSFFAMLQRIRYKNGEIGNMTRNHFSLAEWDESNKWLFKDIGKEIAGDRAAIVRGGTRHTNFFINRVGIPEQYVGKMEDIKVESYYVPADAVEGVQDKLETGDVLHVIFASENGDGWSSHFGLIIKDNDGIVKMLHSTPPKVRIEPLVDYMNRQLEKNIKRAEEGKTLWAGFKFLRPTADPIAELKKLDGENAPVVTGTLGLYKNPPKVLK